MSQTRFKIFAFGSAYGGLATVGCTLYNPDGTMNGARVTAGIVERGTATGTYGASVVFPDAFQGELRGDTGGANPVYTYEEICPLVQVDTSQSLPLAPVAGSVGEMLSASLSRSKGKVVFSPPLGNPGTGQFVVYAKDGTTVLATVPVATDSLGNVVQQG